MLNILFIAILTVSCLTWLIYFTIRMLIIYTDLGQNKKKEKDKKKKIQASDDNIPSFAFQSKKAKIETSFGDDRIGEVHEYEKKI